MLIDRRRHEVLVCRNFLGENHTESSILEDGKEIDVGLLGRKVVRLEYGWKWVNRRAELLPLLPERVCLVDQLERHSELVDNIKRIKAIDKIGRLLSYGNGIYVQLDGSCRRTVVVSSMKLPFCSSADCVGVPLQIC
jgi:hypothetical protein